VDIQVQELIDKIKRDGIESATEEAARITGAAETEAARILESARKEAADIMERARQDAERSGKAGMAALAQASRNLMLVFRDEVQALLEGIVARELGASYDDEVLKKALPEMLAAWKSGDQGSLEVLLGAETLGRLASFFEGKLAAEMKKGLELKAVTGIAGGFRIANRDGSAYYDFSEESVAEMLCAYLNPRLAEVLRGSAKDK
jgi:V/A-type H+-transporting ATPase subunit E